LGPIEIYPLAGLRPLPDAEGKEQEGEEEPKEKEKDEIHGGPAFWG
jgi:hypothetical protein